MMDRMRGFEFDFVLCIFTEFRIKVILGTSGKHQNGDRLRRSG